MIKQGYREYVKRLWIDLTVEEKVWLLTMSNDALVQLSMNLPLESTSTAMCHLTTFIDRCVGRTLNLNCAPSISIEANTPYIPHRTVVHSTLISPV